MSQTQQEQFPSKSQLGTSAVSGVKWNFVSQGGQQVAQLLTTIVLTRLLSPADFGLLGMATVITGFINIFKDLGTAAAIIRRAETSSYLLSTIFWANATLGGIATLVLAVVAPAVAAFYHQPAITPILRILSICFVISGLSNLHKALLERRLSFRLLTGVELASTVAGGSVGVFMAFHGAGVWALVAQSLTTVTLNTLLLWITGGYKPTACFRWDDLKGVTGFSLNLTGYNVFNYFVRNADNLLVGRFLGALSLGVYAFAYRIMLYPLQSVTTVISRVMYPIYSRIQHDEENFRAAFARTAGLIALITFPLMLGVLVLAQPFVLLIFGYQWNSAIILVRILAPLGMAQSIIATTGAIYQARGRTDLLFIWGVSSGIVTVTAFVIGLHWGVVGVATSYTIASVLLMLPCLIIPLRLIHMQLRQLVAPLMRPLCAALLMSAGLRASMQLITMPVRVYSLFAYIFAGAVLYLIASLLINKHQIKDALHLIRR